MNKNRRKETETTAEVMLKEFLDMIAPSVVHFYTDYYVLVFIYNYDIIHNVHPGENCPHQKAQILPTHSRT